MGQLTDVLGISPSAATQLVDGLVGGRHAAGTQGRARRLRAADEEVALRRMVVRRRRVAAGFARMSDEVPAFVKGLRALTEWFGAAAGEAPASQTSR